MEKIQTVNKKPTVELLLLIEDAVKSFGSFAEKWQKVIDKGQEDGLTPEELEEHARPFLRRLGLTKRQIEYKFNMEQIKQHSKITYEKIKHNIVPNDDKKDLEDSSSINMEQEQETDWVPEEDSNPQPETETETEPQISDIKFVEEGTVPEALRKIVDKMKQFNFRPGKIKMDLTIYYI